MANMEHKAARLDALMGNQREVLAAMADIRAALHQLSMDHAETRRMTERRRNRQPSASRHARPRAEDRGELYRESDFRGPRWDEVRPQKEMRRGGLAVERRLADGDHTRVPS